MGGRTSVGKPGNGGVVGDWRRGGECGAGLLSFASWPAKPVVDLEADGKHVLTDSWTSFGVVAGLGLVGRSARGLLDYGDPATGRRIREELDRISEELGLNYHGVRFRTTGYREIVEVHLLFPHLTPVVEAHRLATLLEERLPKELGIPAEVITRNHWTITPTYIGRNTTPANRINFAVSF
jgi:Dimerisation domain of Zinc Transporter